MGKNKNLIRDIENSEKLLRSLKSDMVNIEMIIQFLNIEDVDRDKCEKAIKHINKKIKDMKHTPKDKLGTKIKLKKLNKRYKNER